MTICSYYGITHLELDCPYFLTCVSITRGQFPLSVGTISANVRNFRVHLDPLLVQFRSSGAWWPNYLGPATSPDTKDLPGSCIQQSHISTITITAMN
jgi:hypothetical protein